MTEEEEKAIRTQFQNILNGLINNKIAPTGTAILNAEQPMILLFEELIYKIEKQQKEIEYLNQQIPTDKIFYYSERDYISKNKIREKIKEVSNGIYDAKGILAKLLEE